MRTICMLLSFLVLFCGGAKTFPCVGREKAGGTSLMLRPLNGPYDGSVRLCFSYSSFSLCLRPVWALIPGHSLRDLPLVSAWYLGLRLSTPDISICAYYLGARLLSRVHAGPRAI
jgi:hypothetical protein